VNRVQLITDGTANLPPERLLDLGVICLPIVAQTGDRSFIYDQQANGHIALLEEMGKSRQPVQIVGPSPDDFRAVFERTLYRTNKMLLILSSGRLSPIVHNARVAARDFMGRCDITILDSQTLSVGLGLLVEQAGVLLREGTLPLPAIVRHLRGMIPHIYVVMITHTLEYLYRSKKVTSMQAILGAMLDIHPYLVIEEGEIQPLEKSRSASKALDKLVEFASEFSRVQEMIVFQSGSEQTQEEAQELREELEQLLPGREVPVITYDPVIASHIGPDGVGLIVYEGRRF
jgi:DegV family protein with EDD domain